MGAVSEFRVFLSAVTSEFGQARDTLAASLRARDLLLRVQSDFTQTDADTTLRKLHDYIKECTVFVCILGKRSGGLPPAAAALPFRAMLPDNVTQASYTQWEFFFARHHKRRMGTSKNPLPNALKSRFNKAITDPARTDSRCTSPASST